MLFLLSVPAINDRGSQYLEPVLAALHQSNTGRLPFALAFAHTGENVSLQIRVPPELASILRSQLYAQYPDCHLEEIPEKSLFPPPGSGTWQARLFLQPDLFPLRRYSQFEDLLNRQSADPIAAILSTLVPRGKQLSVPRIEIIVRPAPAARTRRATKALRKLATISSPRLRLLYANHASSPKVRDRLFCFLVALLAGRRGAPTHSPLETSTTRAHDREEDLQAAADKLGRPLFETRIVLSISGPREGASKANQKLREMAGSFGQFRNRQAALYFSRTRHRRWLRWRQRPGFLLSTEELATLWHPPTLTVRAETLPTVESRELEPPVSLPTPAKAKDLAQLGVAVFRGKRKLCGILQNDRRRHLLIEGRTGMGKSTLLHNLITSDITAGRGLALVDPHGDLCEAVLASIPSFRSNEVILFDAGDTAYPLSYNILACDHPEQRPLIASGVLSAFKKLYAEFFGPRMEHIFRNALLTLLEVPGTTLVSLLRLLTDETFRQSMVARVADPVVANFWQREFSSLHPKLQAEALAPILNKVGAFVSSPLLRHLVGQARSRLNLRTVMDQGKILLVNLSKGRMGDDASALLGSFLVTGIQLAAMSRADLPEEQRKDFSLYVDEFQNYATDSFATILSEARKYRLNLTVANQYLAQMDEATQAAVFGNIGSLVCFQLGAQDAEIMAEQLGGDLTPQDLLRLPAYLAYIRLLIEGYPSKPFTLQTLPPRQRKNDPRRPDIIRRVSRNRYAQPAPAVEQEIRGVFAAR